MSIFSITNIIYSALDLSIFRISPPVLPFITDYEKFNRFRQDCSVNKYQNVNIGVPINLISIIFQSRCSLITVIQFRANPS